MEHNVQLEEQSAKQLALDATAEATLAIPTLEEEFRMASARAAADVPDTPTTLMREVASKLVHAAQFKVHDVKHAAVESMTRLMLTADTAEDVKYACDSAAAEAFPTPTLTSEAERDHTQAEQLTPHKAKQFELDVNAEKTAAMVAADEALPIACASPLAVEVVTPTEAMSAEVSELTQPEQLAPHMSKHCELALMADRVLLEGEEDAEAMARAKAVADAPVSPPALVRVKAKEAAHPEQFDPHIFRHAFDVRSPKVPLTLK